MKTRIATAAISTQETWPSSIVVVGFVLALGVFAFGAKALIPLFSGAHCLVVRRFGANCRQREETLEVLAGAFRTSGKFSASHEALELVAAGVTVEIEERHFRETTEAKTTERRKNEEGS